MKAKRCPICGGEPQFVYYALPEYQAPNAWDYDEEGEREPMIMYKRLECKNCKATNHNLVLGCEEAVRMWNNEKIVQLISTEPIEGEDNG